MLSNRKIIDLHCHIWPDNLSARAVHNIGSYYSIDMHCNGTAEGLLENSASLPGARFVISSATLKEEALVNGNEFLLSEADAHNEFIPFASFYPFMGQKAAGLELERCIKRGAKGVKLHPDFQSFAIDDPRLFDKYEVCSSLGLPILFHVGDENSDISSPERLYNVANRFPSLKIICAHLGGYMAWDEGERILVGSNVYTETSDALVGLDRERVVSLIRKFGAERIMFGSDYPLRSPSEVFTEFDALPLTENEKEQIYWKTAKKLFNL